MADDDAAKRRREARRRRILQSPEERMRKIASVASDNTNSTTDAIDSNQETVVTEKSNDSGNKTEMKTETNNCAHSVLEQRETNKLLKEIGLVNVEDKDCKEIGSTGTSANNFTQRESLSPEGQTDNQAYQLWILTRTLVAIFLGVTFRLMLCFEIAGLNKQSVVAAFLVSHIVWMKYNPFEDPYAASRPIPLPGLITTLLLAGVQNPALAVISKIINTITNCLINLALFLFVFICTHCIVEVIS